MPASKTRPVRIHDADLGPLQLIARLEQRSPAEVVHEALTEYLANHKDELAEIFTATQAAIAAGDLEALGHVAARSTEDRVDAAMRDLDAIP